MRRILARGRLQRWRGATSTACRGRSRSSSPTSGRCRASPGCGAASGPPSTASSPTTRRSSIVVVELAGVDPDSIEVARRGARAHDRRPARRGRASRARSTSRPRSSTAASSGRSSSHEDVDVDAATASYERGMLTDHAAASPSAPRARPVAVDRRQGRMSEPRSSRRPGASCPRGSGAAAEGDGRLPRVDDAARGRPGALDQADRRRRRRRADARARHGRRTPRPSRPAGTTSTRSARSPSSTR